MALSSLWYSVCVYVHVCVCVCVCVLYGGKKTKPDDEMAIYSCDKESRNRKLHEVPNH